MSDQTETSDVPKAPSYPFYVQTDDEMRRFDLAVAIAAEVMDAPPESAAAWGAARVLYASDLPT